MDPLRRLWQLLTIDAPWAISNWLWACIVNPLLASLRQLTLRRMVYLAAFIAFAFAFVWAAAELSLSADVALLLAGDSALYFEIAIFASLAVVQGRLYRAIVPAAQMLRAALRRNGQAIVRAMARARRMPRPPRLFDKDDSGDVPDGAFAFA